MRFGLPPLPLERRSNSRKGQRHEQRVRRDFRVGNGYSKMNFCKREIAIDRLTDDEMTRLESHLRAGEVRPYTGTVSEQSALKAYFQEFVITSDEELSVLVSRQDNPDDSDQIVNFTFLLKDDYEALLARIANA